MTPPLASIPGVANVHTLHGPDADPTAPPGLLVEVPHGADTQAHYDALAQRLESPLPAHLDRFFHVNTDVGAWDVGLAAAQQWVDADPTRSAVAIRCAIPRTFIDVNRVIDVAVSDGLTPGLMPWITVPEDRMLLRALHDRYTVLVRGAYQRVCGAGGLALIPHTYAPRTVPIDHIGMDIVDALERVYAPGVIEIAPLRPEVDLITVTPEGDDRSPPGVADAFTEQLAAVGIAVERNGAYNLHPVTMGARWSNAWPGRVLCFEVRRDLVTHWEPFVTKALRADGITTIARCLAHALG
ncbi:MAG: hypothetical protein R3F61_04555 [Myxococcota bacterium]